MAPTRHYGLERIWFDDVAKTGGKIPDKSLVALSARCLLL